jgi:hypothetical protein
MQKVIRLVPLAFVATTSLVACSFSMRGGTGTNPPNQQGQAAQPANGSAPAATPAKTGPSRGKLGKRSSGPSGPTPTPSTNPPPTPSTPPTPAGAPVVSGATPFGSGTFDATGGYKGSIYWVPAGTTKLPDLTTMQPNGFLFTKEINAAPQAFAGFPGLEARKENFAIRYESPLTVTTEADYDFRIVADDGAVLKIDNTPIVDNDGARAAPAEKTGPVHLVAGSHFITVDYFQTTGNVALQVFCKMANDTEKLCPTSL